MSSLLDRVAEDARGLQRRAGTEDRRVLDQYLTTVRETELRLNNVREKNASTPPRSQAKRPAVPSDLNEQVESMIDLIGLALWTDSTRCVTYMLGNSNSRMIFDFLGVHEQHHYLSHFFRNFSRSNLDALLKISLWHMEKFDYLLRRLKSFENHHGSLLEHCIVLFGSGMGHSDNHTATRIPTILAGQGGGRVKTGRYLRYAENQQLGTLHLALLQQFGVALDHYGGSTQALSGLDGARIDAYQERPFDSWVRRDHDAITVQGRLRLSEDLNEARIFYVDVAGAPSIRVDVEFRDFHDFNLAYHCGTPIRLTGRGTERGGQLSIHKITELKSLLGKQPGSQRG